MTDRQLDVLLKRAWSAEDESAAIKALQAGASPNLKMGGYPLLVLAAGIGREDLVSALLTAGAEVNATDRDGMTALMYVAWMGGSEAHGRIFDRLVESGADINKRSGKGATPFDLASHWLNRPMVEKLLALHAQGDPESHDLARELKAGKIGWTRS